MKPVIVDSTNITALAYQEGDLFVRFKATGTYRYKGVPLEVAAKVVFAESPGSTLNELVKKPGYAFEKVDAGTFSDEKVEVAP